MKNEIHQKIRFSLLDAYIFRRISQQCKTLYWIYQFRYFIRSVNHPNPDIIQTTSHIPNRRLKRNHPLDIIDS